MRELTCKNCGGRINPVTMQCEYCGSQYETQLDRIVFVNDRKADILSAAVLINNEFLDTMSEDASKYAIHMLTYKLAEALTKHLDIKVMERPELKSQEVRASVRVLPVGYRF